MRTGKYRDGELAVKREKGAFLQWYVGHHLHADRTAAIVETVVDARTHEQLLKTLAVADVVLPQEIRASLDEVSAPYIGYPESCV